MIKLVLTIKIFLPLFFNLTFGENSNEPYDQNTLSLNQTKKLKKILFSDYKKTIISDRSNEMNQQVISFKDKKMKFDLKYFGEKSENGWALYFSLHGGGGVPFKANEKSWIRHKTLYSLKNGILLTPRAPTDTWNMWHQDHVDELLSRLIQNMISFHDVDPDKIYLMGYSAGGDGVYQLAPRMADRFAAAAMMAGHPNESSPLGLRNLAFTIHMGDKDSAYNRNDVAVSWGRQLEELQNNDPDGYKHFVKIYKNKGHWMDGLDSSAISWMSQFVRNPHPKKIIWKQDDVLHNRFYWLKNEKPLVDDLVKVEIDKQTIKIHESTPANLIILLNDELVNMDEKIKIEFKGKQLFNGYVYRSKNTIMNSIKEYGDYRNIYYGEISISLTP